MFIMLFIRSDTGSLQWEMGFPPHTRAPAGSCGRTSQGRGLELQCWAAIICGGCSSSVGRSAIESVATDMLRAPLEGTTNTPIS